MSSKKLLAGRITSVLAGLMFMFLAVRAHALTPAGTEIRNQSVATYLDANEQPQISTSNEVINIVDKVYGVVITPDKDGTTNVDDDKPFNYLNDPALSQTTAPGNVAYYHYYLENTGNTPDTYELISGFNSDQLAPVKVEVYYDANGNGLVDAGDILLATDGTNATETPLVAQGEIISLIVAVHTPTTATDSDKIHTDIDATSTGDSNVSDAVSNWNLTEFSSGTGILTATKAANVSSAKPGDTITYTIEGSNTGSADVYAIVYASGIDMDGDGNEEAREGILIVDEIDFNKLELETDGDKNYKAITDILVSGPSKAKVLFWDEGGSNQRWTPNDTATWTTEPKLALFIPDADSVLTEDHGDGIAGPVLSPGQGYKFSFSIKVKTPYTDEVKLIENQVKATYAKDDTGAEEKIESNKSLVTVGGDPSTTTPGVAIGPWKSATADHASDLEYDSDDHSQITKEITAEALVDLTSGGERDAGEVVVFPLTILNPNEKLPVGDKKGNGGPATLADVFNITYNNPDTANFSVVLYKADGTTPLSDTNGDGRPDTGSIEPGETADIVVKVFIKAGAAVSSDTDFTITAASTIDSTVTDNTTLRIEKVLSAGVDIATSGKLAGNDNATESDATGADDDEETTKDGIAPGATQEFAVQVGNMRPIDQTADGTADETTTVADTYNLTYEKLGAASSFIVQLYNDLDGDGELDENELVQISDTGWLPAIEDVSGTIAADDPGVFNLIVRVQVPKGTPAGDYFIKVTATSTNNDDVEDSMHILVRVNDAAGIEVSPDNTATVVAGGTYIFAHDIINTGNVAGDVVVEYSELPNGYSAVWVDCTTGAILNGGGDFTIAAASFAPEAKVPVCLKVFVPANAPAGTVLPITITGTLTYGVDDDDDPLVVDDSALDILTIIDGALELKKYNDPSTDVKPGESIEYTTKFKNLSPGVLQSANIDDAIPANTVLDTSDLESIKGVGPDGIEYNADADGAKFEFSTDNGVTWNAFSGYTNQVVTNVRFIVGDVPAGEEGEFVFSVIVK